MSIDVTTPRPMTADQARAIVDEIKSRVDDIRELVVELHDRQGWKSLGYKSWRDCVIKEFDQSTSYLYRQLQAALIERELSPIGDIPTNPTDKVEMSPIGDKPKPIPESQIRPLAKLPTPESRKEAFDEAKSTATNGKLTAKDVQKAVNRRLGPKEKAAAEARENRVNGQSRVNGVVKDDPPEVAAQRASGRLASNIVPDVETVGGESDEEESEQQKSADDTLSDQDWLDTLPARSLISETCRTRFDRDAIGYRKIVAPLDDFRKAVRKVLKAADRSGNQLPSYLYRVNAFLTLNHPKHWTVCPKESDGGCGGKGAVGMMGSCQKCFGGGYRIS